MFAPESRCAPATLPFSITATGTSPSFSVSSGSSSSSCMSLIAQASPAGPAADDRDADLDPLVLGIGRRGDELAGGFDRRRELCWGYGHLGTVISPHPRLGEATQPPFFALTASVSFGRILCRSPTTPRSQNSKIGAFGSLLIARMFSELCMPTLCWIAPEIPAAR